MKRKLSLILSLAIVATFVFGSASITSAISITKKVDKTSPELANNISPNARLWQNGRMVILTGPVLCEKDQVIEIHVRVTQENGATGEGVYNAFCTGDQDEWMAIVKDWGLPFKPGGATAHAWATTWNQSGTVKSWDWSNETTLK